ncbi:MAG TPA: hypothetical protein VKV69_06785 [Actinomycetota bacterium]|nr:hypothetical protein [Actinomycetota bacterium]
MISTRYRVATAFTLIAAGIVVAIIGYLGVSKETEVAFQLPYFASAGVGALMLLGFGGILLLNSQLETDSDRMEELEEAVRQLSNEVGKLVDELSPQRGTRPARAVAAEKEKAGSDDTPAPRTRRTKARIPTE